MEPDWNFRIDDENAKYRVPPDDIHLPLKATVAKLREATEACQIAALELGVEIKLEFRLARRGLDPRNE
jgi:hypothetical protein